MFNRLPIRRMLAAHAVVCAALSAHVASACPTCKDSLTEQYVAAYGYSIMFMMSMPFLIFASLGLYFYWEVCKARKKQMGERGAGRAKGDVVGAVGSAGASPSQDRLPLASG